MFLNSRRSSTACRTLIESDWYQARWGERYSLTRRAVKHLCNGAGGERRAMTFQSVTGFGADIMVIDDAHDIKSVDSKAIRDDVLRTWDEVLQTRLNDPQTGIFILIMQRSHERDLVGHILAKEFNGMHVCLPAEFERDHPYVFLNPDRCRAALIRAPAAMADQSSANPGTISAGRANRYGKPAFRSKNSSGSTQP